MRKNQNQKVFALMVVFTLLSVLFAFPVGAQEVPSEGEVVYDAVLYGAVDEAVADTEAVADDGAVIDAKDENTAAGEEVAVEEEVFKGNTIGHNALKDIAGVPKLVPQDDRMVETAKNMGIIFGD